MPKETKVLIVMGSDSDLPVMNEAAKILEELGVGFELKILSAHRTPEMVISAVKSAEQKGIKVFIAGAGMAAHLAGFVAAWTTLPVIGVPLEGSALNGLDALLSMVQMPSGIPVATMAIGKAGAKNAGIMAASIIALSDGNVADAIRKLRKKMAEDVEEKNKKL